MTSKPGPSENDAGKTRTSIEVLINNMRRKPDEWRMDDFHVSHRSGINIWIGNGISNYHIKKPHHQDLSLSERLKLRKALKELKEQLPSL